MSKELLPRKEMSPAERFTQTLLSRMLADIQETDPLKGKRTMSNKPLSGNYISSKWLLSDGKTRVGAFWIEHYPDKLLLKADQLLKGDGQYRVYDVIRLLNLNPKDIPIPDPKVKITSNLSQLIAGVSISQTEAGRSARVIEELFRRSEANPNKLTREAWSVFKTVEGNRVVVRIRTDRSIPGPSFLGESMTWDVAINKIEKLTSEIPRAKLLEAKLTSRNRLGEDILTLLNSLHTNPLR